MNSFKNLFMISCPLKILKSGYICENKQRLCQILGLID